MAASMLSVAEVVVIFFAIAPLARAQDATETIRNVQDWKYFRDCAKYCFFAGNGWNSVAEKLSCSQPALDFCICRLDLQSQAVSYLSTCVLSACGSNRNDVTSATSFYVNYCTNNGYLAEGPATASAQTTAAMQTTATATATRTVVATSYSTPTITSTPAPTTSSSTAAPSEYRLHLVCVMVSFVASTHQPLITHHRAVLIFYSLCR